MTLDFIQKYSIIKDLSTSYFLKSIGQIIGWGPQKAILSLALSVLTFFVPIYYLIIKFIKNNFEKIFFVLILTSLLIGQDGSSSIAFFKRDY